MWGNDPEVLRVLLDGGADANLPDFEGKPLLSRMELTRLKMVKVLVEEYGADINLPDSRGRTPLCYAMQANGNCEAYLKELGAQR